MPSGAEGTVGPFFCSVDPFRYSTAAAPLDMISFTYVVEDIGKGTIYVQFDPPDVWFKPAPGNDWVENCTGRGEPASNYNAWMIYFDSDATNQVAAKEEAYSYIYMYETRDRISYPLSSRLHTKGPPQVRN